MLVRYDPFRSFDRASDHGSWMPMDAIRHEQHVELRFDLPGVAPESIDVEVERNVLTVRAERTWQLAEGADVLVRERLQGAVTRQVMLGELLDTDRLEASYDAGVLTVTIPVLEEAKPRKIEIHAGSSAALEGGSDN